LVLGSCNPGSKNKIILGVLKKVISLPLEMLLQKFSRRLRNKPKNVLKKPKKSLIYNENRSDLAALKICKAILTSI
jgi:hypothetical protein